MATKELVEKVRGIINATLATPIEKLASNPGWGSINFQDALAPLELTFSLATHLKDLPLEIVPDPIAEQFYQAFATVNNAIERIRTFDLLQTTNPSATKLEIVGVVKQAAEQLLVGVQNWIPFLAYQRGDVQRNIAALNDAVGSAKTILASAQQDTEAQAKQISDIVTAAREASASVGVGVFTSDFEGQAARLETEATSWLRRTAICAALTLGAAIVFFFLALPTDAKTPQLLQYLTSKLVVLGVLATATIWCGRIYKALKHQASTNSHRANSLRTFQAFTKAATDDATRDAVLLETTRSIFSLTASGYLDSAEPTADTGTKVLEIFKGAGSKA